MSINKVMILGRLGQDPELKHTPSGQPVANFSVATSEKWKDKNGQPQEKAEWHRVVVWGKLAELCNQYLSKGREVFLEGKNATRSWEDKDGNKRYSTEVVAQNVQFIGGGQGQGGQNRQQQEPANTAGPAGQDNPDFAADDIPF